MAAADKPSPASLDMAYTRNLVVCIVVCMYLMLNYRHRVPMLYHLREVSMFRAY